MDATQLCPNQMLGIAVDSCRRGRIRRRNNMDFRNGTDCTDNIANPCIPRVKYCYECDPTLPLPVHNPSCGLTITLTPETPFLFKSIASFRAFSPPGMTCTLLGTNSPETSHLLMFAYIGSVT